MTKQKMSREELNKESLRLSALIRNGSETGLLAAPIMKDWIERYFKSRLDDALVFAGFTPPIVWELHDVAFQGSI